MTPIAIEAPRELDAHPVEKMVVTESPAEYKQTTTALADNPLDRVYRGDREGTIKLNALPTFTENEDGLLEKRKWVKGTWIDEDTNSLWEHLALGFRFWGKLGYGEGISGHITVRDPILRDHFWMNPFGLHFSEMRVSDLVLVTPDGYVHPMGAQLPINMAGFYIHSEIHHARPEVEAAAHCHSLHGKAWSCFGRPVDITTQDSCLFYNNQVVYENFGGIVLAAQEGENIAKALGPTKKCCILQNHGLLTLGHTVDEAVYLFSALDKQCKCQLMIEAAAANGIKKSIISDEDAAFTAATIQHPENVYFNLKPEVEMIRRREPDTLL